MKKIKDNLEVYIGSIFLSITFVLVVINVFTRYFVHYTINWSEEVAVASFVWVIFLGFSYSYRNNKLIGISALVNLLPKRAGNFVRLITNICVFIISAIMLFFSFNYTANMTKTTAALEAPYQLVYASIVISFALICIYAIIKIINSIKRLSDVEEKEED